ncbi:hypothetical protein D3C84_743670 [compost metagenome]
MPDRVHHRPVGALELIATLIRRDRSTAQQIGHIQLGVFKTHVFADVVEAHFIGRCGLLAGEVEIDGPIKHGAISEQFVGHGFIGGIFWRRIGNGFFHW